MPSPTPHTKSDYPHRLPIATRWMDNDVYGHVNNVVYYSYFDTVVNAYLVKEGGLDIESSPVIGLCVESQCRYLAPVSRRRPRRATSSTSSSIERPAVPPICPNGCEPR